MKQTRILVAATLLAAALGACKKTEKAEPTPKPEPKAQLDAAPAPKPAVVDAAPVTDGKIKPFLYAVEKDGNTLFLLGSMHIGVDPSSLPDWVFTRVDAAKTFAMEADVSDINATKALMLPEGKSLDKMLGDDYWKKLVDAVGAPMAEGLKGFKPAAAATLLELHGLPMTLPMDMVLLERAKDHKAKVVYLEEAALQERVLEKWYDVQMLKDMLDTLDESGAKQQELFDAYKRGDEATMEKLGADKSDWKRSPEEYDAMMKDLLYDRNASWIPALEKMLGDGGAFVVVGAAHLIGPGSVIDLLRKKGYSVTRVES